MNRICTLARRVYLGYVQGMNDLLSPILIVMENEVDAFWCFAGLMERMQQNFHMDQSHIKRQLGNLHTLLQYIDADLANYLGNKPIRLKDVS